MNKHLLPILFFMLTLTGCVGEAPKPQPYLREQGDFYMQEGVKSTAQYNFALAARHFEFARDFYARYDDQAATTRALLNLAQVHILSGQYDAAASSLGKASALIEHNNLSILGTHYNVLLSSLYLASAKLDQADALFSNLDASLRAGSHDDTSLVLLANRVRLAQLRNAQADEWLNLFAQRINNNAALTARLQRFQAWQAYQQNNAARGTELFTSALNTYRTLADAVAVMHTRQEWADAAAAQGEWNTAIEQNEKLLSLAMANHHLELGLRAIEALKLAYSKTGQTDKLPPLEQWKTELKALPVNVLVR
jgi:hypothetical protein